MLEIAGGIIVAAIVLTALGSFAKNIEVRYLNGKTQKLLNLIANRSSPQLSDEDKKLYKIFKVVSVKCDWAAKFIKEKDHRVPEVALSADSKLEAFLQTCLKTAETISDSFCRSAMYHEISDLLSKAGKFERAKQLIELIKVDFLQEQSIELYDRLLHASKLDEVAAKQTQKNFTDGTLTPDGQAALAAQNALSDQIKNLQMDDLVDSPEGAASFITSRDTCAKADRMSLVEEVISKSNKDPTKIRVGLQNLSSDKQAMIDWNDIEKSALKNAANMSSFEKILRILGKAGVAFTN